MNDTPPDADDLNHHTESMRGRDPKEYRRAATPLELLFDLTFVIAFGLAASQLAHALAQGHYVVGLTGFGFAAFAICWAWINFSWFASAYDTDDWIFRLVTMVQMIGVLVLAIGVPRMFASLEHGAHLDNSIMVLGYVIIRGAMVFQWLRAARQDSSRRRASLTYAAAITAAQVGWVVMIFLDLSVFASLLVVVALSAVEMIGPWLAEGQDGGTPWHAHHIAERYSLLAIIGLGEGVVGTVATVAAVIQSQGWTVDAGLVCLAGMGLTFGMWWIYDLLPSAEILHSHRERGIIWGYGHMVVFGAIVATGAGLHVAAYFIEGEAKIGSVATVLTVALPVCIYLLSVDALYAYLVRSFDPMHYALRIASILVVAASVFAAMAGLGMAACLIILMFAPVITIIGHELRGHRHEAEAIEDETVGDEGGVQTANTVH